LLKLVSGEMVPSEDGYTVLHHFFANYESCIEAEKFFELLILF